MNIKEIDYGVFGKCVSLSNDHIEVYVTVDFGPRIIRHGFIGGENFFKEDTGFTLKMDVTDSKFADNTFYIRGGHRCWISPEAAPRVRYPDNKPLSYNIDENKVIFTQTQQEANEIQLSFEIEVNDIENSVLINHIITNTSYWPKEYSVWPITVMAPNGLLYAPMNSSETDLTPNRSFALWHYSKINDPRLNMTDKYFSVRHDYSVDDNFKIGTMQNYPWAAYFHHGDMFVKKYQVNQKAKYPDLGSSFETYVDKNVLEIETLSELKVVEPGEANSHLEKWTLFNDVPPPSNDNEMDEILNKYSLNIPI